MIDKVWVVVLAFLRASSISRPCESDKIKMFFVEGEAMAISSQVTNQSG